MIEDHQAAVAAFLAPLNVAPVTVYDGSVPGKPTWPYLVWRMTTGFGEGTKLCGTTDQETFLVYVTSVGLTRLAVAKVADQVRSALVDQRPVVAGWSCERMKRQTSIPITEDRDVTDPNTNLHPLYAVDTYVFLSRKD